LFFLSKVLCFISFQSSRIKLHSSSSKGKLLIQIVSWSCFSIVVVFYIDRVDFFGDVCVVATIVAMIVMATIVVVMVVMAIMMVVIIVQYVVIHFHLTLFMVLVMLFYYYFS
jgi:hypothetical protein